MLTDPNANIGKLLSTAASQVNQILANSRSVTAGAAAAAAAARRTRQAVPTPGAEPLVAHEVGNIDGGRSRSGPARPMRRWPRAAAGPTPAGPPGQAQSVRATAFLIGAVVCFAFFSWYPMVREVVMSFQQTAAGRDHAGWAGRTTPGSSHDPTFWPAWQNTLEFTVLALILGYAVPFFVAILLNELRHAKGYLRVLVYLPVMLPPASALLLFEYFYDPSYGLFNHILHAAAPADLAVGAVARHRHAEQRDDLGGHRVDLDEHGRRDADLPGRAAEHPGRAVRGGRAGRRRASGAGSGTSPSRRPG